MKKFFVLFFSCLVLFSCESKAPVNEFTRNSSINSADSSNIQYNITWNDIISSPVDIRIVTLKKNGETHDYVVANNYIGHGGGLAIDHWPGCKCFKK